MTDRWPHLAYVSQCKASDFSFSSSTFPSSNSLSFLFVSFQLITNVEEDGHTMGAAKIEIFELILHRFSSKISACFPVSAFYDAVSFHQQWSSVQIVHIWVFLAALSPTEMTSEGLSSWKSSFIMQTSGLYLMTENVLKKKNKKTRLQDIKVINDKLFDFPPPKKSLHQYEFYIELRKIER